MGPTESVTADDSLAIASDGPEGLRDGSGLRLRQAPELRFDANVSILFGDQPILRRPALAAAAGFDAIEMWWPFDRSIPSPREVDRIIASVADEGLSLVLLNLDSGNALAGEHGLLTIPDERARFRDNLDVAVEIAGRLGGRVLNALYGNVSPHIREAARRETAAENLAYAAQRAATIGASIVLEPLNRYDFPRYGLRTIEGTITLADFVLRETGASVDALFDVYNIQRTEGDLIRRIEAYAPRFGHVQIADVPGRYRPGTGEIAFERVLGSLECTGYAGYVGLEYRRSPESDDTFAWLPRARRRSGAVVCQRAGRSSTGSSGASTT